MIRRNKKPDLFVLGEEAVVDPPRREVTRDVSREEGGGADDLAADFGSDPFLIHVASPDGVTLRGSPAEAAVGPVTGPSGFMQRFSTSWSAALRGLERRTGWLMAAPLLAITALATPMVARELRSNSPGKPARVPAIAQLPVTPRADAGREMTASARVPDRSRRPNRVRKEVRPSRPINPPTRSSAASPQVPSDPVSASPSPAPTGGGSADRESFGIEN
jgi:hypothetical protein